MVDKDNDEVIPEETEGVTADHNALSRTAGSAAAESAMTPVHGRDTVSAAAMFDGPLTDSAVDTSSTGLGRTRLPVVVSVTVPSATRLTTMSTLVASSPEAPG